jgi:DNA-binding transcriptional MerR regulator
LAEPTESPDAPTGGRAGRLGRPSASPKLYRVGDLVTYCGLSRQTVHNYTVIGLLQEVRWTPGGHRLYDKSAFERLDEIARMKASGKSLQEIRERFARLDEEQRQGRAPEGRSPR